MKHFITAFLILLSVQAHAATGDKVFFVPYPVFNAYTSHMRSTSTFPRISDNLPTQFDMVMLAGVDYSLELTHVTSTGTPINLAGSNFYAQFRDAPAPAGTIFANFSTPITSTGSGLSRVTLSKAQTQRLSGSTGFWDLLHVTADGVKKYRMSGRVRVQSNITVAP
jgi:hypothetical protein